MFKKVPALVIGLLLVVVVGAVVGMFAPSDPEHDVHPDPSGPHNQRYSAAEIHINVLETQIQKLQEENRALREELKGK